MTRKFLFSKVGWASWVEKKSAALLMESRVRPGGNYFCDDRELGWFVCCSAKFYQQTSAAPLFTINSACSA